MAMTFRTDFGEYVQGLLSESEELWFNFFAASAPLDHDVDAGPVQVPVLSAVVPVTPDGTTVLSNVANNTLKTITVATLAAPFHLDPKNKRSFEAGDTRFMGTFAKAALDGVLLLMADAANDLIFTGTPANSATIEAGKALFAADTTSIATIEASAYSFVQTINEALDPVLAAGGQLPADIVMIASKTAYKNLKSIMKLTSRGLGSALDYNNTTGQLTFDGIKIFRSSATEETNWGVVSKECLYILHKNSFFAKPARMEAKFVNADGTAVDKVILVTTYGIGVLNDALQGMCVSAAS